jgi:drug/metabolite transporter (DMT)-like permease
VVLVVAGDRGVALSSWPGLLAVSLAPLIWAVNVVLSKDLVARESPLVLTTTNLLIGTVCLLPFLGGDVPARLGGMEGAHWGALVFCVLPATVLGYSIWYGALRVLSASNLAVWAFAVPIVSLIGGAAVFGEALTALKCVGVGLTLYGVYLVNVKYRENNRG